MGRVFLMQFLKRCTDTNPVSTGPGAWRTGVFLILTVNLISEHLGLDPAGSHKAPAVPGPAPRRGGGSAAAARGRPSNSFFPGRNHHRVVQASLSRLTAGPLGHWARDSDPRHMMDRTGRSAEIHEIVT